MPKVKYCVTEFTPTANQVGMSHSFNAKVVINSDIDGDNNQNILFEMMAICISDGTRIIIEQNAKRGTRYIMVDLAPTDNSNSECEYDGQHVCWITSVDGDDEGSVYEKFTNYMDACRWLADFIRHGDFQEIYIETY